MVPQQTYDSNLLVSNSEMEITALNMMPKFGSQLVDKNSATPYSDATQVSYLFYFKYTC